MVIEHEQREAGVDAVRLADHHLSMFDHAPRARADMVAGTLYAVTGEGMWIYYGQVTPEKNVGFFRRRDREIADVEAILATPVMTVITVAFPSITRAMRSGKWKKLGRFGVAAELLAPRPSVQWPVGTLDVLVWLGDEPLRETRVDDPTIQDMELMAVWDAEHHVPARLSADFGAEPAAWHIGGPIRRQRRVKEERAARFPEASWDTLPSDWVPTTIR